MSAQFIKNNIGIYTWESSLPVTIGTIGRQANIVDYNDEVNSIKRNEIIHLSNIVKMEPLKIIMLNQVHGNSIIIPDKIPKEQSTVFPEADGMITDIKELCLVIRTADCVPVFAFDTVKKVIGAVHSGWRGCRQNIAGKLIAQMKRVFGSKADNIVVFILPSIGPLDYNINSDVAAFFQDDTEIKNGKIYLDLWQNIESSLLQAGILKDNIYNSRISTYTNPSFFSYRRGDSGRNINFCQIK